MRNIEFRGREPHRSAPFWVAASMALLISGSAGALAQPAPSAPAAPPAAPAAPTPAETAARARAAAVAAKANVDITEAWTRATPSATTAPIFLHIISAKDPDRLLGVESAMAKSVELRDDTPQATARVMPNPAIDLPAGGTLNLGPGGRYLNLVGLKAPLKEGDSFIVTLKFDKAGSSSTVVKILGAAAAGPPPASSARKGDTTAGVSQR